MGKLKLPTTPVENWQAVRDAWVQTVTKLVTDVEGWCKARDWPTRRIEKKISDRSLGEYVVPALLIQVDLVKLLLDPVARFAPGSDGVIDLYKMPEYSDAATLFQKNGKWMYAATVTDSKLPPEQVPTQPDSDVVTMTGRFSEKTFAGLIPLLV